MSTHSTTYSWRCAGAAPPVASSPRVIDRSLPKGIAIQMPSADVTVTEHILGLAPGRYGRSALVDPASGVTISYSSLAAKVRAAAAGLARRGMRPGDVAGVHVTSPVAFALASQSIRAAGGVPSPAAPGECNGAIAAQLTECDARMLITDGALVCASLDIAEHSRVRQVISFGQVNGVTRFDALFGAGTSRPLPRTGDHLALLAWIHGADGSAQPVRVTHRELAAQLRTLAADANWRPGTPSSPGRRAATVAATRGCSNSRSRSAPRWWPRPARPERICSTSGTATGQPSHSCRQAAT